MARSSSMTVERDGFGRYLVEYNATTDEILVRHVLRGESKVLALNFDKFIEAVERRIQDNRYRPISEEQRAKDERTLR